MGLFDKLKDLALQAEYQRLKLLDKSEQMAEDNAQLTARIANPNPSEKDIQMARNNQRLAEDLAGATTGVTRLTKELMKKGRSRLAATSYDRRLKNELDPQKAGSIFSGEYTDRILDLSTMRKKYANVKKEIAKQKEFSIKKFFNKPNQEEIDDLTQREAVLKFLLNPREQSYKARADVEDFLKKSNLLFKEKFTFKDLENITGRNNRGIRTTKPLPLSDSTKKSILSRVDKPSQDIRGAQLSGEYIKEDYDMIKNAVDRGGSGLLKLFKDIEDLTEVSYPQAYIWAKRADKALTNKFIKQEEGFLTQILKSKKAAKQKANPFFFDKMNMQDDINYLNRYAKKYEKQKAAEASLFTNASKAKTKALELDLVPSGKVDSPIETYIMNKKPPSEQFLKSEEYAPNPRDQIRRDRLDEQGWRRDFDAEYEAYHKQATSLKGPKLLPKSQRVGYQKWRGRK